MNVSFSFIPFTESTHFNCLTTNDKDLKVCEEDL